MFHKCNITDNIEFLDTGLVLKLRPLTKVLFDTNNLVQESAKILDEFDWSLDALSKMLPHSNGLDNYGLDPLDQLIECAKCLTEDVRRFASFVQVRLCGFFKENLF